MKQKRFKTKIKTILRIVIDVTQSNDNSNKKSFSPSLYYIAMPGFPRLK